MQLLFRAEFNLARFKLLNNILLTNQLTNCWSTEARDINNYRASGAISVSGRLGRRAKTMSAWNVCLSVSGVVLLEELVRETPAYDFFKIENLA